MSTSTLESLARRVETLEAQNARLKQIGVASVLFLGVALFVGISSSRQSGDIEARSIVVKDEAGRIRAKLGVRDGQPALALLDDHGREQVLLRSTPDLASSLEFYQRGRLTLAMESASTGASHLQMIDGDRNLAAGLYAWPEGRSGLALNRGRAGAHLAVNAQGTPRLDFLDPAGRKSAWPAPPLDTLSRDSVARVYPTRPQQQAEFYKTAPASWRQEPSVSSPVNVFGVGL